MPLKAYLLSLCFFCVSLIYSINSWGQADSDGTYTIITSHGNMQIRLINDPNIQNTNSKNDAFKVAEGKYKYLNANGQLVTITFDNLYDRYGSCTIDNDPCTFRAQ